MSILGNRVLRKEDPKLLTVGGSYVHDLRLEGAAHVVYVRSNVAHARLVAVRTEDAKAATGVVDVVTAADLDLAPMRPGIPDVTPGMEWPLLADGTVRFFGEAVAAVVAETEEAATDAAELVFVEYEPLPVVIDPVEAARDEVVLHESAGTNVAHHLSDEPDPGLFDGCEVVVHQRIVNQRLAPCPLEVRGAAASFGPDGRLTHFASSQAPFAVRAALSRALGLEESMVHVIAPDVGGGFGAKVAPYPEEILVAWLARRTGRPIRWSESRSESMVALGHGRGQVQDVTIGGTRAGRVLAYRLEVLQEAGAYPKMGAFLPSLTRLMTTGTYAIERAEFSSRSVVTNTTPTVPYRGAGRPEAASAIERIIDCYADEIAMDPLEVRRLNVVPKASFPYTTAVGTTYDIGDYGAALDALAEAANYRGLRSEQARRRQAGGPLQIGIGLSCYVEITNGGPPSEYASVEVRDDGSVRVTVGTSAHGQGHVTAFSMLVADTLGVDVGLVEVVQSDTDLVAKGEGTFASRSLQTGGVAVHRASGEVLEQAKRLAANLLESSPGGVELEAAGGLRVVGNPDLSWSWAELAAEAMRRSTRLAADVEFKPEGPTFPFGAHCAVVEVDLETGKVRLVRLVAVDDAGRIVNPVLAEGQVHGGIAQGAAQALLEEVLYDADGTPLTSTLADYAFITAGDLPSFETVPMETPTPRNELGAKGIGESGTIGATPAVHNAVVDALAHLGVRHLDMPATPRRVWRAIEAASGTPDR